MKYAIDAQYQTGNSFGNEDASDRVAECDGLETAKENLRRIQEHYHWYKDQRDSTKQRRREYGFDKSLPVPKPEWLENTEYDFQLRLKTDDGETYIICAPWCGYFESLYGANIVTIGEGMGFSV